MHLALHDSDLRSRFSRSRLTRWRTALANVRGNVADATIAHISDSTDTGKGALAAGTMVGARPSSVPALLSDVLDHFGVPAANDSFWGDHNIDSSHTVVSVTNWDSRIAAVVSGANEWGFTGIAAGQFTTLSNRCWANNLGTGALSFTPTKAFDTIDVYYIQGSGKGTFTVDIGGAALATINSAGTTLVVKTTVSTGAPAATGTFNIKRNGTGASISIIGAVARSSTERRVHCLNFAHYGGTTANFTADVAVYDPARFMAFIAADLYIIKLGLNDMANSVSTATYLANMQIIISKALTVGSGCVLLCIPTPQNPATRDPTNVAPAFRAGAYQLALTNNVPLLDLSQRFNSFPVGNAAGLYYDDVHLTAPGYGAVASALGNALLR